MGIADVIPGVSGGTIALITGIYERLVHAVSTVDLSFLWLFLLGKWRRGFAVLRSHDFALFLPLGAGILTSIIVFSRLIDFLLTSYLAYTFAFFLGLIIASALFLYKNTGRINLQRSIFMIFGFLVAFVISTNANIQLNHSLFIIFISGVIAISAMILPGISGSFLLVLFGQYQYILNAIHNMKFVILSVFAAGCLVGLLGFSKLVDYLLKNYKFLTFSFLIGLMVGSLRIPWTHMSQSSAPMWYFIPFVVAGLVVVMALEMIFSKR